MAGEALLLTQFAAAALMVLLAAALLRLDAASRVARVFAAFLIVRAMAAAGPGLARADPASDLAAREMMPLLQLALVGTLAYFLVLYPRGPPRSVQRGALVAAIVAGGAIAATYLLRPCLLLCAPPAGGPTEVGALGFANFMLPALAGGGALLLVRRRARSPHERASLLLIAVGLAAEGVVAGGLTLGGLVGDTPGMMAAYAPGPFARVPHALPLVGLLLAALAVATIARREPRATAARASVFLAALLVAAAVCAFLLTRGEGGAIVALSLLRLTLPGLVGYALLRHRLFDIDLRARWTLSRASVGGLFAAVFFVVSEAVAAAVGQRTSLLLGLLAAGLLLFVLNPIQQAVERVVDAGLGTAGSMTADERRALYRDFVQRAWSDGALVREERAFLDSVRARLSLAAEDALQIESDVAAQETRA